MVLPPRTRKSVGVDDSSLDFDVRVTTANGAAMAAETRLDQIAVGPIVMHNVRALVARPGALARACSA